MRIFLATAMSICLPVTLMAAGSDSTKPPEPTVFCSGTEVYDKKLKKCVNPEQSNLQLDDIYQTVRQLAYAKRYDDALALAAVLPEDHDGRATYMGFIHRKLGNAAESRAHYVSAIEANPANILARSYMGQGMVQDGQIADALEQLRAIRANGGNGTWAEASLRTAIATGRTFDY